MSSPQDTRRASRECSPEQPANVPCEATLAWCQCNKDAGHEGPHLCDCFGSWAGERGKEVIVAFPKKNLRTGKINPLGDLADEMFFGGPR